MAVHPIHILVVLLPSLGLLPNAKRQMQLGINTPLPHKVACYLVIATQPQALIGLRSRTPIAAIAQKFIVYQRCLFQSFRLLGGLVFRKLLHPSVLSVSSVVKPRKNPLLLRHTFLHATANPDRTAQFLGEGRLARRDDLRVVGRRGGIRIHAALLIGSKLALVVARSWIGHGFKF